MGLCAQRLIGLPKAYAFALSEAAAALAALIADSDDPQNIERPRRRRKHARIVKVEVVRGAQLSKFDADWRDLLSRADSPNVFIQPRVLRAAGPGRPLVALLAWEPDCGGPRPLGFWGFAVGTPHLSLVPITALCARRPSMPTCRRQLSTASGSTSPCTPCSTRSPPLPICRSWWRSKA